MLHTMFLMELHEEVKPQASILFKTFCDSYSNSQVKRLYSFFVLMEKNYSKHTLHDCWSESNSTYPWEPLGISSRAKTIKSLWHGMERGKKIPATTCPFFFLEFVFVFSFAFLLVLLSSTRKKQKEQNRSL